MIWHTWSRMTSTKQLNSSCSKLIILRQGNSNSKSIRGMIIIIERARKHSGCKTFRRRNIISICRTLGLQGTSRELRCRLEAVSRLPRLHSSVTRKVIKLSQKNHCWMEVTEWRAPKKLSNRWCRQVTAIKLSNLSRTRSAPTSETPKPRKSSKRDRSSSPTNTKK